MNKAACASLQMAIDSTSLSESLSTETILKRAREFYDFLNSPSPENQKEIHKKMDSSIESECLMKLMKWVMEDIEKVDWKTLEK